MEVPAASDTVSGAQKDFRAFDSAELDQIAILARRIVKRLARNPSRRWKPVRSGPRINLRRSLRLSLRTGGELIELSYKKRKLKRTKLFVICDVSGSMDGYSRLLLQFIYGLQNSFAKVETFAFSTSLSRITGYLKNKTYQRALERLSSKVHGWSGGTRIGASLATFNAEWLRRIDRRTIVLILSDGWDIGEPEQLVEELSQLKRRAGRVIWLNPLLGSASYQPVTRGMQAALPFINVFAPAHDLPSLRALEPHWSCRAKMEELFSDIELAMVETARGHGPLIATRGTSPKRKKGRRCGSAKRAGSSVPESPSAAVLTRA